MNKKMHLKSGKKLIYSDIRILIILLIIFTTYLLFNIFTYYSKNMLIEYFKRKSSNIATSIINNVINDNVLKSKYTNLIIENNNSYDIDSKLMNEILLNISDNIMNEIDNNRIEVFFIPSGIIMSSHLLSNVGPKIPIKIEFLKDVSLNPKIETTEYGINNSLIKIYIEIVLNIQIFMPFISDNINLKKEVILDSKIIEGKIPTFYGN